MTKEKYHAALNTVFCYGSDHRWLFVDSDTRQELMDIIGDNIHAPTGTHMSVCGKVTIVEKRTDHLSDRKTLVFAEDEYDGLLPAFFEIGHDGTVTPWAHFHQIRPDYPFRHIAIHKDMESKFPPYFHLSSREPVFDPDGAKFGACHVAVAVDDDGQAVDVRGDGWHMRFEDKKWRRVE